MKNIVFVNATAATEGGILTILNQFIDAILSNSEDVNMYYIFTSLELKINSNNIKIISNIKGKRKLDRIKWDMIGMQKWAKNNKITPDIIVSLQNTGVRFKDIPQMVYIHQPLPYAKESKWNLLKADEKKMWFYKNIYKVWIDLTVKNKADIVVQTKWMKTALLDRGYSEKRITIAKPHMKKIDTFNVQIRTKPYKYLFYPAADYKYKNHTILIKAIKHLIDSNLIKDKFKIMFTLTKDSYVYQEVVKYNVEEYFEFIGNLNYDDVMSYYKGCQAILFPSYIETFGLPLIEAANFGKKILVSDCSYSKEVIGNYELVKFIKYDDVNEWSKEIIKVFEKYEEIPISLVYENEWIYIFNKINEILKDTRKDA